MKKSKISRLSSHSRYLRESALNLLKQFGSLCGAYIQIQSKCNTYQEFEPTPVTPHVASEAIFSSNQVTLQVKVKMTAVLV